MNITVIGGAGFIGCHIASHYLKKGHRVTLLDDLSRRGTELNLRYLQELHAGVRFIRADISKDLAELRAAVEGADVVFHMAAQVAVTTSIQAPRRDFEVNALGTFNLLEAVRSANPEAILIYASTNKVYGHMDDMAVRDAGGRYEYASLPQGVSESQPLEFYSPYGCSKGCGDQYVMDYARIYRLKTVVCRQSCIYGERQFGNEDQGWLAWFAIAALLDRPVTIYGDGKQVRDVLYVGDLIQLYERIVERIDTAQGRCYNVGGGPANTLSLLELVDMLKAKTGRALRTKFSGWRAGDQLVYVSDVRRAREELGWEPRLGVREGVARLYGWASENKEYFERAFPRPAAEAKIAG